MKNTSHRSLPFAFLVVGALVLIAAQLNAEQEATPDSLNKTLYEANSTDIGVIDDTSVISHFAYAGVDRAIYKSKSFPASTPGADPSPFTFYVNPLVMLD